MNPVSSTIIQTHEELTIDYRITFHSVPCKRVVRVLTPLLLLWFNIFLPWLYEHLGFSKPHTCSWTCSDPPNIRPPVDFSSRAKSWKSLRSKSGKRGVWGERVVKYLPAQFLFKNLNVTAYRCGHCKCLHKWRQWSDYQFWNHQEKESWLFQICGNRSRTLNFSKSLLDH
jgi:hypothetical protein